MTTAEQERTLKKIAKRNKARVQFL
eukprot:SAG31_NODE_46740_length_253_cov_0.668831_1_plen_24_part_01